MIDIASMKTPLTNVQFELLKAFAVDLPEEDLKKLRQIISHFMWEKFQDQVDKVWIERGYNQETIQKWLNED